VWFLVLIAAFLVFACVLVPLLALAVVMFIDRRPQPIRGIDRNAAGEVTGDLRPQE